MIFGYYIYPPAYNDTSCQMIEDNMKELNRVLTEHSDQYDRFHYDMTLFEVSTENNASLGDVIWGKLSDKQFSRVVLPQLLNKLTVLKRGYADKSEFDADFKNSHNALWGVKFVENYPYHLNCVDKYKDFRIQSLKMMRSKENFNQLKPLLCPNLIFTNDVINTITTGSDKIFNQMIDRLIDLDGYVGSWMAQDGPFNVNDLNNSTSLRASDESDTVKNNEKKRMERYFVLPGIGGKYCYLHIKTGDYRFHFYADEESRKVYVAYIGPHLTL